jgi:hypothetical protein
MWGDPFVARVSFQAAQGGFLLLRFSPPRASFVSLHQKESSMKRVLLLLASIALALPLAAQDNAKLQADLIAKERALWDAWSKKDAKAFEETLAPDSVSVDPGGVITDKAAAIKMITTHTCDVKSYNLSQEKITNLAKDVVILTYRGDQDVTCDGQKAPATVYATSIWKKQRGKWWAAFHQETPAAPAPPQQ